MAGVEKSRTTPYHPMGNGMVERFNATLLNMLGTLESHQKDDWKTYVAPLVHAYNATRHDSTGYSPFFLMFGRHPRLAVDAYLGLSSPEEPTINAREHYATKLKKRLQFAYKVASTESKKNADRHKANYDLKVREATLDVGDRVLVRQVGLKGKHKLADRWEKIPYVVVAVPNAGIPVYKVKKESGDSIVKTLHRNMLLPFSAISSLPDISGQSNKSVETSKTRSHSKKRSTEQVAEDSDSEQSDSSVTYFKYIIPQRRHSVSTDKSTTVNQPASVNSDTSRISRSLSDLTPVVHTGSNSGAPDSVIMTDNTANLPDSSSSGTSGATELLTHPPEPRRSSRVRNPPDRYGDWVSSQ